MKSALILFLTLFLVGGCVRNPSSESLVTTIDNTPTALPVNATVMPVLDLSALPETLPSSIKGYELVSWQEDGDWWYTLVTGTNRQKSFEELVSPQSWIIPGEFLKISTNSLADLRSILERLPSGSEVIWGGMELSGEVDEGVPYFTYPPEKILADVSALCDQLNIKLVTLSNLE